MVKTIKTYGVNQDITERKLVEQELRKAKVKAEDGELKLKIFFDTLTEGVSLNEIGV